MSRTDVHAPGWVKERDPAWARDFVPDHRHLVSEHWDEHLRRYLVRRIVPCDLAAFLSAKGHAGTRCRMRYVGRRNIYCGCPLCTGQPWRKLRRRQERVQWRSIRRDLLKQSESDVSDVRPIRGKAWW